MGIENKLATVEQVKLVHNEIAGIERELSKNISAIEATIDRKIGSIENFVTDITDNDTGIDVYYKDGSSKNVSTKDSAVKVEDINEVEGGLSIAYTDGSTKEIGISGGGGGDSGGAASITRITEAAVQCVYGDSCPITFNFSAVDSSGDPVGNGTATWYVGNVKKATGTVRQGQNTFDIGSYLNVGDNNIKLSISVDTGGSTPRTTTKTWSVNVINLYATWSYDDTFVNEDDTFTLRWIPYGSDIEKTTHIIIDGTEAATSKTTYSGSQQSLTLNSLSHGSHMVELYLTATVNEMEIRSESILHSMIFVESGNTAPVISCRAADTEINQYDTLRIPIAVYDPSSLTANVTLAVNGTTMAQWTNVDRALHYWNYTPEEYGDKVLTITCGQTVRTIHVTVRKLDIENAETEGWTFRMKASSMAGNDALRAWRDNGVDVSFSQNFDWTNGGIQTETDNSGNIRQYIRVKAGTRMTINHQMFADDAKVNGKTFKMIFKVENCRDYDASVAQCYANSIGIQMAAHNAQFSSTGTSLSVPYGEDEMIELEFDIYPAPRMEDDGNYRYMMAWIDGVITTARIYNSSDSFAQSAANRQNFEIGSDDCDVCVYLVKLYPNVLTRDEHIENFIADAPNAQEKIKRYNRNNILDASGEIDYEKLAVQNPDCRVWLYEIPRLTQGKKDKVEGCTFQQIWKNGDQYYQLTGSGTMTVQGTSSVDYLKGAANTDINFEGGELKDGYGNNLLSDSLEHKGFKIHDDSMPITYSNTKVNFASCEQVNNMCNAEWYQRFQPYPSVTPRDCMEFSMGVQFINDKSGDLWDDNRYHMYSIGNMGTSKKNVHVFHDTHNPKECCIEVNDNTHDQCRMISDDLSGEDWSGDFYFGMRYPDTKNPSDDIKNGWQRFLTWMAANNPNAATGQPLDAPVTYGVYTFKGHDRAGKQVLKGTTVTQYAGTYTHDTFAYRMAKMLSECEDYMVMDSVVYHFVYLERHTMVDNVSKNSFWSSSDLLHWDLSKAYDMDTSDGNNNEGQMVFDYGNEANDVIGTKTVFNANDAVWFVFVSNLYEACQTMFVDREAAGAWSASAYHQYLLGEQQKVPERVWVQCYWYDYLRTYEKGISSAWLSFLDGGQKTHQRWHYEYFEEAYDASKYRGTASTVQNVTIRGYTPDNWTGVEPQSKIAIKMYNKCYILIKAASTYKSVKAERGQIYTVDFSDVGYLNDTEINLYTAQMIQEIGDLSPLYPGYCNFANATRLRSLQVGSTVSGYSNTNLENLDFGTNPMLEYLYVQNLPNATGGLDLKKCVSLLYLDARGSSFTSYEFAAGGLLQEAYLQSPTSLTLRELQYLTDQNLHIGSYDRLVKLRWENCPNLDALAMVNAAVNLNRLRIIGVNWTLADISKLKAYSNNDLFGGIDDNDYETTHSVMSGSAHITGGDVRISDMQKFNQLWPDLNITYGIDVNYINTWKATYYNDKEVLATLYIDEGSATPNVGFINSATLVESQFADYNFKEINGSRIPTKEKDQASVYTFSGWTNLTNSITMDTIITANFSASPRQYNVRWFAKPDDTTPIYELSGNYGSEFTYNSSTTERNFDTGTAFQSELITKIVDTHIEYTGIKYFTGQWDKSTGYVTDDIDVYGVWEQADVPVAGTDMQDMTTGEIIAVTQLGYTNDYFESKDQFTLVLGTDFDFSNVQNTVLVGENGTLSQGELSLDGSTAIDTGIKLFGENEKSFTMAIDFRFGSTTADNTLVSCFETDGTEGFRLRYSGAPNVQWGDKTQSFGNATYRDILVLRHVKGEDKLYVYASNGTGSSSLFSGAIATAELTRSRSTSTEASLVLGGVKDTADGSFSNYGTGTIYWCKIWYDDLGDANARQLAIWPREQLQMEFCGAGRYTLANDSSKKSNASFIAKSLLGDRGMYHYSVPKSNIYPDGYYVNWGNASYHHYGSALKSFCNNRVYNAIPIVWRRMIKSVVTKSYTSRYNYVDKDGYVSYPKGTLSSSDKIYVPALNEICNAGGAYAGEGSAIDFFTTTTSRIKQKGNDNAVWWLRTGGTSDQYGNVFISINTSGGYNNNDLNNVFGICLCFSV